MGHDVSSKHAFVPPNPNELHMAAFRPALKGLPPGKPRTRPRSKVGSGLSRLTVGGAQL